MLKYLRALAYQQQFGALVQAAQGYYLERGDLQALPLQGLAHAHLGEDEAARTLLWQAQQWQDQLDREVQVDLGVALLQLGEVAEAEWLLNEAVQHLPQQSPQQAYARAHLAWLAQRCGRTEEALEGYRQVFAHMPGLVMVWPNLVRLLLDQRQPGEAQEVLQYARDVLLRLQTEFDTAALQQQLANLDLLQWEIWCATEQYAMAENWLSERVANLEVAEVFRQALIHSHQTDVMQRLPVVHSVSVH
jgi:predicted Zn-dependent protease